MKKYNITMGCDPEVFIFNQITDKFVSVEGMIKDGEIGTKKQPLYIKDGYGLQEDGVALEYNIPPAKSKQEFIDSNMFMLEASKIFLPDGCSLKIQTTAEFDKESLMTEQTREAGCDPDNCVWDSYREWIKPDISNTNLRHCGGHIHIGYPNFNLRETVLMLKKLELFVGVPSLLLDSSIERRKFYGQAGAFRFKNFGYEYRVLSNFWLKDEKSIGQMYDNVINALNTDIEESELDELKDTIQNTINNADVNSVYDLCNKYNINIEKIKV